MLVFARKAGETVVIPELGITFKIIRVKSAGNICVGIEAPLHIRVHRGEIAELIEAEAELKHPPVATGDHPAPVQIWSQKTGKKIATKISKSKGRKS